MKKKYINILVPVIATALFVFAPVVLAIVGIGVLFYIATSLFTESL